MNHMNKDVVSFSQEKNGKMQGFYFFSAIEHLYLHPTFKINLNH